MKDRAGRPEDYKSKNSTPVPLGKTYFLGIGINQYESWSNLRNAVRDMEAVRDLLQDKYGVIIWKTLKNKEATRPNVISALDQLIQEIEAPDSAIIYYAGHGHLKGANDNNKRGFLVPSDAKKTGTASLIRNSTLRDYFQDSEAQHVLFISDACFSGALLVERSAEAEDQMLGELAARPSRWVMCSGRHDEKVLDGPSGGHSPFAQALIDELTYNQKRGLNAATLAQKVQLQSKANYRNQLSDYGPIFDAGDKRGQLVLWQDGEPEVASKPEPKLEQEPEPAPDRSPTPKAHAPLQPSPDLPAIMDIPTFKKLVNAALIEDNQSQALAYFNEFIKEREGILDSVILLQGRTARARRNSDIGIISITDLGQELNRINHSIRSLLEDVRPNMLKD